MWRLEREHGSIIRGLQRGLSSVSELERTEQAEADEQRKQLLASTVPAPVREAVGAAIYSFQHGLQRLTDTLQTRLEQDWPQQFNLLLNHKVQHIQMNDTENGIMVSLFKLSSLH
jgi:Sec-independent protein translocase protein TatA